MVGKTSDPALSSAGRIFTVGTSNRTEQAFLALLRAYGIEQLVDVRRFPTSQRFPHFKKEALAAACRSAGLHYLWLGDLLGGYRKGGYEAYMQTPGFAQGLNRLERLAQEHPTAFCCSERLPWKCHRRFIARALESRGWQVVHILDEDRIWTPGQLQLAF
ncbi:MAG: DUF488 domain-containing protein [Calditrichaeota bacterium]|nr:MAG: DUF488 domain-containing protein [Calditrichota bacterium]